MKRILCGVFVWVLAMSVSVVALAGLSDFAGRWKNSNPNTRGITTLVITVQGVNVTVHAWGKCHPRDCDWGMVRATAYAPSVSSNLARDARALVAEFRSSFSDTLLVIKAKHNKLKVESYTHFTDRSHRTDYTNVYEFRRARQASTVAEDCVSFDPVSAKVVRIRGHWKIVDGSHWLFDFGPKKREAYKALRIIKYYRMDQVCYVGRPGPSFEYMLSSGDAPSGSIRGEDCLPFDPDAISLRKINGRWKIVEGSQWLFDFGHNRGEAEQAFRIIKKYRFRYTCFVGRPHASFKYLKR